MKVTYALPKYSEIEFFRSLCRIKRNLGTLSGSSAGLLGDPHEDWIGSVL